MCVCLVSVCVWEQFGCVHVGTVRVCACGNSSGVCVGTVRVCACGNSSSVCMGEEGTGTRVKLRHAQKHTVKHENPQAILKYVGTHVRL